MTTQPFELLATFHTSLAASSIARPLRLPGAGSTGEKEDQALIELSAQKSQPRARKQPINAILLPVSKKNTPSHAEDLRDMTLPRVRVTVFLVLCGVARPLAGEVVRDFQVAKCTTRWLNVSATKTPPSGARARRGPTQQPIQSFLPWKKNKQHSQGRTEPHKPRKRCTTTGQCAPWQRTKVNGRLRE